MIDYRDVLQEEFAKRRHANAAYSLRAFARDLGCPPSRMSEVLSKKCHFSPKRIKQLCKSLLSDGGDQKVLELIALSQAARSVAERQSYEKKLRTIRQKKINILGAKLFSTLSRWYHLAIVEAQKIPRLAADPVALKKGLGITQQSYRKSLDLLSEHGLIKRETTGAIRLLSPDNTTQSDHSSDSIQQFHAQVLARAAKALSTQSVAQREFSSTYIAVRGEKLPLLKQKLRNFRKEILAEFGEDHGHGEALYCLSMQLFNLLDKEDI